MSSQTTPIHLDLKKDQGLEIRWQDGVKTVYPLDYLRSMCPCALCKQARQEIADKSKNKRSLTILPGNYTDRPRVLSAELVGNYALRLDWADNHGSGIYSFQYLREIGKTVPY